VEVDEVFAAGFPEISLPDNDHYTRTDMKILSESITSLVAFPPLQSGILYGMDNSVWHRELKQTLSNVPEMMEMDGTFFFISGRNCI
jgi:hypothetical protein